MAAEEKRMAMEDVLYLMSMDGESLFYEAIHSSSFS